jgi:hypothetical protein
LIKRFIAAILSLWIPVLSWADLTNIAQVSYQDASGAAHSATSNTVTVVVGAALPGNPPPSALPTVDLLKVPHVMPVDGTITIVATNASLIHWTLTRQAGSAQVFAAAFDLSPATPGGSVSTASPALALTSLSLTPGDYTLVVTAENSAGAQSAPAQATVTLVANDLGGVRVFPNPWRTDRHNNEDVTFGQLTDNVRIRIFTISGQLVKDLGNAVSAAKWDLTNDSGDRVGSGIYLYLITNNLGQQTRGKLAIIR